jgi:SAM-dependent methyltransferase
MAEMAKCLTRILMLDKYQFFGRVLRDASPFESILDLGCRDKVLKGQIPNSVTYQGIDHESNSDNEILAYNLESGVPFEDNSFDLVVALDVLEHLENIHSLLSEAIRVAKKDLIIALPNIYYWKFRVKFLLGMDLDKKKYRLPPQKILDRHRWITSYRSSLEFIEKNTPSGYEITVHPFIADRKRWKALHYLDRIFVKFFPNVFAYDVFFHIHPKN